MDFMNNGSSSSFVLSEKQDHSRRNGSFAKQLYRLLEEFRTSMIATQTGVAPLPDGIWGVWSAFSWSKKACLLKPLGNEICCRAFRWVQLINTCDLQRCPCSGLDDQQDAFRMPSI